MVSLIDLEVQHVADEMLYSSFITKCGWWDVLFLHNKVCGLFSYRLNLFGVWLFVSTLQQFKNMKFLTDFQVEEYYGAKGVDTWSLKMWEKVISNNDVCLLFNLLIDCLTFFAVAFTFIDLCSIVLGPMAFTLRSLIVVLLKLIYCITI